MPRVIIAGPTSAGKSRMALHVAEYFGCPVISADARQCYKYLNIGTGKVSEDEQKRVSHYNISLLDPAEKDTAAGFAERCRNWEAELARHYGLILYAGGSTLHLNSILFPLDELPEADPDNIQELEQEADTYGIEYLYNKLAKADPEYCQKMDGMNRQRIIRALDVLKQTGRPFSTFHRKEERSPQADLIFVLNPERKLLHERINRRVDDMLEQGLVEEVRSLLNAGYSPELQSMKTVGYREVIAYLQGELSYEAMAEKIKTNTRQYARRQLTWFRRWPQTIWMDSGRPETEIRNELITRIETVIPNNSEHA